MGDPIAPPESQPASQRAKTEHEQFLQQAASVLASTAVKVNCVA